MLGEVMESLGVKSRSVKLNWAPESSPNNQSQFYVNWALISPTTCRFTNHNTFESKGKSNILTTLHRQHFQTPKNNKGSLRPRHKLIGKRSHFTFGFCIYAVDDLV